MPFAVRWRVAMPLLALALWMSTLTPATFAAPPLAGENRELIVLLSRGAALPEEVVESARQGRGLPGGLGVGSPTEARFLLPFRATGERLEAFQRNPDDPRARMERYVILRYPLPANLKAIQQALQSNPWVLSVEENRPVRFHATPSDPLFPAVSNPAQYQWGLHALNLPQAWDKVRGHAWIGAIDVGLQVNHPDLRTFHPTTGAYEGGNFRPNLSFDFYSNDGDVDELANPIYPGRAGHGTHVSGIIAATANNNAGGAGVCWNCSLAMTRTNGLADVAAALTWYIDRGFQVINMSFGYDQGYTCSNSAVTAICGALFVAESRGVTLVASSGNDKTDIDFPASDSRVIAVGGIEPDLSFWEEATCPYPNSVQECGSNYTKTSGTKQQDLVAPAQSVLSTVYTGMNWITEFECGDGSNSDGYGLCTGTSMAAPHVSGIAGLIYSANPLLTKQNVYQILVQNANRAGVWDFKLGYGVPNAYASTSAALGKVNGQTLSNRLTPLFSLYSDTSEDSFYTTSPQMAVAAMQVTPSYYHSVGPYAADYFQFPGATPCFSGPCDPKTSVYIFTGHVTPASTSVALVPLYRLTYKPVDAQDTDRDTTYAVSTAEIGTFKASGYNLDGIEGYIYQRCSPEPQCIPAGAVKLHRLRKESINDWAIFPESELTAMQAAGYTTALNSQSIIGYVYPNVDTDNDAVIDGFETLMGTSASSDDSDCDGTIDGVEILEYPYTDPKLPYSCGKRAQVLSQTLPSTMVAGHTYSVSVTLKNSGSVAWNPVGAQCNAYRWASLNNHWTTVRAELPNSLSPGQQVTLTFNVKAPSTPGTYDFAWQMVHECVEWFGDAAPVVAVTVRAAQTKDAQVLSQTVPSTMTAGQSYAVSLKVKNVGTQSWNVVGPQCNAYRLGSLHTQWSPTRAELTGTVASGQEVTFSFNVTAPATPGTYAFRWQMVQECVQWFGDQSPSVNVTVN